MESGCCHVELNLKRREGEEEVRGGEQPQQVPITAQKQSVHDVCVKQRKKILEHVN